MEMNELSRNSKGGTELMLERLHQAMPLELMKNFQIIPSRVREIDPTRKSILWLHDLPNDPESAKLSDPEYRKNFAKIVCVSDWQMQMYNTILGLPYSECVVIRNAIIPIETHVKPDPKEQINLIYHTTPHRGLALLIPVFERLLEFHDNIHLHVYSSFEIYGWKERDKPYEELFHRCKNHPNITYHGFKNNDEVREALKNSHIFAFPSIWPETSCLAAIEALSAGCLVVAPNLAGLTDTVNRWGMTYQYDEDPQRHALAFFHALNGAIINVNSDSPEYRDYINGQKGFYDTFYDWGGVQQMWRQLLESL